jgi:hypothetical protein
MHDRHQPLEHVMKIVITAEVPVRAQDPSRAARPGAIIRQVLLTDHAADGLNFRLIRSQYQEGELAFESPRHRHAFQQLRWTESGSVNYAPDQDIPEGDIAYFPRSAYYGPQRKDKGIALLLQYGFGNEFLGGSTGQARGGEQAMAALRARGTFAGGEYTDTDPDTGRPRRRDAVQAIYEERTQTPFTVPPEGYDTPVLMHTKAFAYYQAAPGVQVRHLGSFYDHPGPHADLRISTVLLTSGGTCRFGPDRANIAWTTTPGLLADGTVYPEMTCLYSPRGDDAAVTTDDSTEMFLIELPRLD